MVCEGGGGVWQLNNLIEFGLVFGILADNVCGCVSRSSRIMTPRAEEPSIQFQGTTILRAPTYFIF